MANLGITVTADAKNALGTLVKLQAQLENIGKIKGTGFSKSFINLQKEQEKTLQKQIDLQGKKADAVSRFAVAEQKTIQQAMRANQQAAKAKDKAVKDEIRTEQQKSKLALNIRMTEAKTVKDLEKLKADAVKLQGFERFKAEKNISQKIKKVQEQEAAWRKAKLLAAGNTIIRTFTGVAAAFEKIGLPQGLSLSARALSDVVRAMQTFKKEGSLSGLQGLTRAWGRVFEGLAKGITTLWLNVLGTMLKVATNIMGKILNVFKRTFQGMSIALAAFLAKATVDFIRFSHAISGAVILIPEATEKTFSKAFKGVAQIVRDIPSEFRDIAAGLTEIVSTGIENINEALIITREAARGAVSGMTNVATATSGLLTVISAYNMSAKDSSKINDLLFRTVDKSRASFTQLTQEMGFFIGVARNANLALEEVFATFSLITRVLRPEQAGIATARLIEAVTTPSEEILQRMQALDISPFQFGQFGERIFLGMENFLTRLASKNFPTHIIRQLFPDARQFRAATSIIGQGVANIEKMFDSFGNFIGAQSKPFETMSNTIQNILLQLWNNIRLLGATLIRPLDKPLTLFVTKIKDFAIGIGDTLRKHIERGGFGRVVSRIQGMVNDIDFSTGTTKAESFFLGLDNLMNKALDLIDKVRQNFGTIKDTVKDVFVTIVTTHLPKIIETFKIVGGLILDLAKISLTVLKPVILIAEKAVNLSSFIFGDSSKLSRAKSDRKKLQEELDSIRTKKREPIKLESGSISEETKKEIKALDDREKIIISKIEGLNKKIELLTELTANTGLGINPAIDAVIKAFIELEAVGGKALDKFLKLLQDFAAGTKEAGEKAGTALTEGMNRMLDVSTTVEFLKREEEEFNDHVQRLRLQLLEAGGVLSPQTFDTMIAKMRSHLIDRGFKPITKEAVQLANDAFEELQKLLEFPEKFNFSREQTERVLEDARKRALDVTPFKTLRGLTGTKRLEALDPTGRIEELNQLEHKSGIITQEKADAAKELGLNYGIYADFLEEGIRREMDTLRLQFRRNDAAQKQIDLLEKFRILQAKIQSAQIRADVGETVGEVVMAKLKARQFEERPVQIIADRIVNIFDDMGSRIETTLTDVFNTGELNFRNFAESIQKIMNRAISGIIADLIRLKLRTAILGEAAGDAGGGLNILAAIGSLFGAAGGAAPPSTGTNPSPAGPGGGGSLARHSGGMITKDTPRFHSGGFNRLLAEDERMAVLQTGEGVLSREGIKNLGKLNKGQLSKDSSQGNLTINMPVTIEAIDPVSGAELIQPMITKNDPLLRAMYRRWQIDQRR
ncbi:MAG: phage tail tape measure protein [bacterium]